jgi:murein L,D-transpeptidase YafK
MSPNNMKKAVLISIGGIFVFGAIFLIAAQANGGKFLPNFEKMFDSKTENNIEPLPVLTNPMIVVKKKERKLYVYEGDKIVKTYNVGLGFAPEGDKEKQGDGKTPEGEFYIFTRNPKSSYYLSLGVSYPSIEDAKRGLEQKLITRKEHDSIVRAIKNKQTPPQKTRLGGEIYIHGNGSATDWTWGCVALDDAQMKELFDAIPVGTNVRIEP